MPDTLLRFFGSSSLGRFGILLLAMLWAAQSGLAAAAVKPADSKAVQAVVKAQLAALAADDASRAFSYAAPGIRTSVGTPQAFIAMVRSQYPMVYRPRSVALLVPEDGDNPNEVVQRVQLTDLDGETWLANYALQRQKNGSWRIAACVVQRSAGRSA